MSNSLYYGEIAAYISSKLVENPDNKTRIDHVMSNQSEGDTIWTLCAEAAKVFDKVEDLSGEHFVNWYKAVDVFSQEMLDYLLSGKKPTIVDMVSMTARSIENSR